MFIGFVEIKENKNKTDIRKSTQNSTTELDPCLIINAYIFKILFHTLFFFYEKTHVSIIITNYDYRICVTDVNNVYKYILFSYG